MRSACVLPLVVALSCAPDVPPADDGGPDGAPREGTAGLSLLAGLAGLWSGPATQTVLGDFPVMNMDLRAVDERALFGRVDLDDANNLRFLLSVEEHGDGPVLVYRNGGYFQGVLRDSRTALVDADESTGTYRFCSLEGGCEYIDAVFELDGDALLFDATVNGATHVVWSAARLEERQLPSPFPVDEEPGAPDAPFPPLPSAEVTASWPEPAPAGAKVLLSLSTAACPLTPTAGCDWSRSFIATLDGGETSVALPLEQLHPGGYRVNAVLDLAGDGAPSSGDRVSMPNRALIVPAEGSASLSLSLSIEL